MKICYVAIDGTQFDTEKECLTYEQTIGHITGFADGEKITLSDTTINYFLNEVEYLSAPTEAAIKFIHNALDDANLTTRGIDLSRPGIYGWNSNYQEWEYLPDVLSKAREEVERLQAIVALFD